MLLLIDVSCGSLSNPANGQCSTTGTVYQSIASYSCNTGYILSGVQSQTCQDNGQWSGSAPECVRKLRTSTLNFEKKVLYMCVCLYILISC